MTLLQFLIDWREKAKREKPPVFVTMKELTELRWNQQVNEKVEISLDLVSMLEREFGKASGWFTDNRRQDLDEYMSATRHKNLKRLAWVDKKIAELSDK